MNYRRSYDRVLVVYVLMSIIKYNLENSKTELLQVLVNTIAT